MQNWYAINAFIWLLWRDLRVLTKDMVNNILDGLLLPLSFVFVSGYIMPHFGSFAVDFGPFMVVGSAVGMCMNSASTYSSDLTSDLEGPRNISYELVLPLPAWAVYVKMGLLYTIKSIILNFLVFPVGALLLYRQFDFANIQIFKFLLMYVLINLFFGFFALLVAVYVKDMVSFGRFWIRWGWQLFIFAGFQFPWGYMYKAVPAVGILSLLNPLVYTFEGTRAALLGQEGYMPYWVCFAMLIAYTILFMYWGLRIFQRKLDIVR